MDWITDKIAVGNFHDARDASKHELDAMLCLAPNCCTEDNDDLNVLCVSLVDGSGNNKVLIDYAIRFIHDHVSHNERILVHCHAGRSRSISVVARYLMISQRLTRHQALSKISEKREIYLSPGIEEIIDM